MHEHACVSCSQFSIATINSVCYTEEASTLALGIYMQPRRSVYIFVFLHHIYIYMAAIICICHLLHLLILLLLLSILAHQSDQAAAAGGGMNSGLKYRQNASSALFVFGDSVVDTGNNNFIVTVAKSNFPPYGRDFRDKEATGRFGSGRLLIDYIASYMGIKDYMPPYLEPNLSLQELMTGVIFASAASGYDDLTAKVLSVITMTQQLQYFKEYKQRVADQIGRDRMELLISNSVFLISAGSNDFLVNYFPLPFRKNFTVPQYQQFILEQATDFIQALRDEGVGRIVVLNMPPIGCLPAVISINSWDLSRSCVDSYTSVATEYNPRLQNRLTEIMQNQTNRGLKLYYGDLYGALLDMIQNPQVYGLIETSFKCNAIIPSCPDATKYVFWDAIHPSEKAYYNIFLSLRPVIDSALIGS